jgi:serine O-acetyltransferase
MRAEVIYKLGRTLYLWKVPFLPLIFEYLNYLLHNSYIPSSSFIGEQTIFAYGGIAVVIHPHAHIGNHCLLGQGITIGGRNGLKDVPHIEDNVYIGAGARILGAIRTGHDSIIGPNSVVTKDIEPFSVVAGVPARLISKIDRVNFEKKYKYYYGPKQFLDFAKE